MSIGDAMVKPDLSTELVLGDSIRPLANSTGSSPSRGRLKARANDVHQNAKGTARAESGCYTCRIRRKVCNIHLHYRCLVNLIAHHQKCDEKPDAEGSCQTCVRLRLQCLGFGANLRPDWMRVRLAFSFTNSCPVPLAIIF